MDHKRVLIVDDDALLLTLVEAFTEHLRPGHEIVTASNGMSALAELQQKSFDLVLTDYEMPHMNGLDLACAARQICPNLPIVLMSGSNYYEVQVGTRSTNLTGFLAKPFSLPELKEILQQNGI